MIPLLILLCLTGYIAAAFGPSTVAYALGQRKREEALKTLATTNPTEFEILVATWRHEKMEQAIQALTPITPEPETPSLLQKAQSLAKQGAKRLASWTTLEPSLRDPFKPKTSA